MSETDSTQWWVARVGNLLIWSRLRIRPAGTAEIFDSSGSTLSYDSPDSARAALMDAEFRAFDGLDEGDAMSLGLPLEVLAPPQAEESRLALLMVQPLPQQH